MRILIADDDPVSRRLLEATLSRLGHEVVSVANGTDAIEQLARPDGPRLAVLDWMMPGADGLAVCRAVRQRPGPYVYAILLTSHNRREDLVVGLDAEADDFLTKPLDVVELRARVRSGERVIALQEGLLEAQATLQRLARFDELTGLCNRRTILESLAEAVDRARRDRGHLGVAMADLDHFKTINDTYGHAGGDEVLRRVAKRIATVLGSDDTVGRYGGEEFLVVVPEADAARVGRVAERCRLAVADMSVPVADTVVRPTVSVGLASSRLLGYDEDALIQAADAALYQAKADGRNRVVNWTGHTRSLPEVPAVIERASIGGPAAVRF
jgi:two-component system cell cycle response regulator